MSDFIFDAVEEKKLSRVFVECKKSSKLGSRVMYLPSDWRLVTERLAMECSMYDSRAGDGLGSDSFSFCCSFGVSWRRK